MSQMEDLDVKIAGLVENSLFLSEKQEIKILERLKTATLKEKESLLLILEKEKAALSGAVKEYIKVNGKAALGELNRILSKGKSKVMVVKEEADCEFEGEEMDKLLDELDNS
ncbi:MAG: hypothetical protein O3B47_01545 [bacterium]|nr:hypothetical protein [bacterium]